MFWTWLGALPIPLQMFIIISVIIAIVVMSISGKVGFKWGKTVIGLGRDKNDKNDKKNIEDTLNYIISKREDLLTNINKIRMVDTIHKQMQYAIDKTTSINNILIITFEKLIDSKLDDIDITLDKRSEIKYREIKHFECLAELMIRNIIKDFRQAFKLNGINAKDTIKFNKYLQDKYDTIISGVNDILLEYWPLEVTFVSAADIRHSIRDHAKDELQLIINQVFDNAYEVYECSVTKIDKLDVEYEELKVKIKEYCL